MHMFSKAQSIFLLILISIVIMSCKVHHLYFVRHAEKAGAMQKDPPLTERGEKRALDLALLLGNRNIGEVYSTRTDRTLSTAKPIAENHSLSVKIYSPDTVGVLLNRLMKGTQNVLVVGHSNTVLPMLEILGVKHGKKEIADWEYDNIFSVSIRDRGRKGKKVNLKVQKYGQQSRPDIY